MSVKCQKIVKITHQRNQPFGSRALRLWKLFILLILLFTFSFHITRFVQTTVQNQGLV